MRLRGFPASGFPGFGAVWLRGCVASGLRGFGAVWLRGYTASMLSPSAEIPMRTASA